MRLTLAIDDGGRARLGEGDPLPPEDRVTAAPHRAFDALYRTQAPRLLRLFGRSSVRADAEDLLNDSFVRFLAAPAVAEESVDNPEAYLNEVARNTLRNRARAAFHRSVVDLDLDEASVRDTVDPVAALEARDMLARLQAAAAKLPAKTRSIFMAHRLDGVTYAELARTHGLSVKGIEWHMSKAIAHLHRAAGKR